MNNGVDICIADFMALAGHAYIRANRLLQESEKARDEGRAYDYTNEMASYDLDFFVDIDRWFNVNLLK